MLDLGEGPGGEIFGCLGPRQVLEQLPGLLQRLDFSTRRRTVGQLGGDGARLGVIQLAIEIGDQVGTLGGSQPLLVRGHRHRALRPVLPANRSTSAPWGRHRSAAPRAFPTSAAHRSRRRWPLPEDETRRSARSLGGSNPRSVLGLAQKPPGMLGMLGIEPIPRRGLPTEMLLLGPRPCPHAGEVSGRPIVVERGARPAGIRVHRGGGQGLAHAPDRRRPKRSGSSRP